MRLETSLSSFITDVSSRSAEGRSGAEAREIDGSGTDGRAGATGPVASPSWAAAAVVALPRTRAFSAPSPTAAMATSARARAYSGACRLRFSVSWAIVGVGALR